ncbi:MAG TPA: dipicolinate synthase subunit B [Firmicutes bacterium]|jgi:dipicolinate synthase subunit B|nr:dipicolinate synthase subunit B [Bacillota bacterium]
MRLAGITVGWGITGSFCSFDEVLPQIARVQSEGAEVIAVVSPAAATTDTRFGTSADLMAALEELTGKQPITTILEAEPTGQKKQFDCFVIAPCTGNTLAKLANAITDTPVLMAAKGTLRNLKPVVVAISTNDALGNNARNIGALLNMRHVYMVPFGQDNAETKPNSCVAEFSLIPDTIVAAVSNRQLQPLLIDRVKRLVR